MNRLQDKRKEKGTHDERSSKGDNLAHLDAGSSDLGRGTRLQPLTPCKSTRLPPLKSQRLPVIQNVSALSATKPDFDLYPMGYGKPGTNGVEVKSNHTATIKPFRLSDNEKARNNKKQHAKDRLKIPEDIKLVNSSDVLGYDKFDVKPNENHQTDRIKPHPPHILKDSRTTLKPAYPVKRYDDDQKVTWQKERDLLRKHRKQQVERLKASTKPVKATVAFDSTGKEMKKPNQESEKACKMSSVTEKIKIDLSVRRKGDDDEDWDWDKDIEEYMSIEEKERTSHHRISGMYFPDQYVGHWGNATVSLNCTKKGVGFKSKKRLEEERRQEQERIEKDRKEKERIKHIVPQAIRKDLKKYGFR